MKGIGRFAPLNTMNGGENCLGFTGEPIRNEQELDELCVKESSFNYNEYVVYDNGQAVPAYLIKVNFKFK